MQFYHARNTRFHGVYENILLYTRKACLQIFSFSSPEERNGKEKFLIMRIGNFMSYDWEKSVIPFHMYESETESTFSVLFLEKALEKN